ncbi:hypothetical protein C2E21_7072 [Chlorella sorokiniana]|uniref:Uncharacterized protein n=1 Tax=Chlorella sorokiniana TaxID=3076 RepID=A0A2P6TIJ5_CHLSO|nr:hypothetical protein C2E21_7072 [Chlorella sorokiniana]|eukprot:PRW39063.1 hypothetical protein C2E21_7072 [Chlorella sorokiniana]
MHQGRPGGRRSSAGAAWLLCASLLALSAHAATATCSGTGCPHAGDQAGITTLYRRVAAWSDYAEPLAVLQLGRPAGALHFLPPLRGQTEAAGSLLAVGDDGGSLHLLSLDGRLVAQHHTGTPSPVTALGSYRFGHNTTVLLTGHASGELRLHTLLSPPGAQRRSSGSWEDAAADGFHPSISLLEAIQPEALLCSTPAAAACGNSSGSSSGACAASSGCAPITSVHSLARGGMAAATIVAADGLGRLAVLKHGGPTGLGVRVVRHSALEQAPTAVRPSGSTAAVLGSSGAANQHLSMPAAAAPSEAAAAGQQQHQAEGSGGGAGAAASGARPTAFKSCKGLAGSSMIAAAFDGQHTNRAYAVATNGSVLVLVVGGERGTLAGCTVRSAAPLPDGLLPLQQQSGGGDSGSNTARDSGSQQQQQQQPVMQLAVLPGYLIVAAGGHLAVYNVTAAPRSPPRLLLHQPLAALAEPFGVAAAAASTDKQTLPAPLLAVSRQGQHVALALNATVLAIYQASFPFQAPRQPNKGALAWMQVLQPLAMVGVAVVVLAKARTRRGGGDGSDFGLGGGGRGGMAGDPRLREFERLLQNPLTAGATARQRHRPWDDGSGSEMEDSGGRARGGGGSRGAGRGKDKQGGGGGGGLLSRLRSGAGGNSSGGSRGREARWRRAATMAAGDDADIAALRAELAGGSEDEEMDLDIDAEELMRGGGSGGFGSVLSEEADALLLGGGAGRRGSDDLSQLSQVRQRFGQARIS